MAFIPIFKAPGLIIFTLHILEITTMKNSLLILLAAAFFFYGCSSDEGIKEGLENTESSILITGINESISYTFSSANGRAESSIPEDVNLIQILVLDEDNDIVYEQYHYNQNAYNEYYYDSADHAGDDYLFENTLPDTLYIPPLPDGEYTVLASTAYISYYNYHYDSGNDDSSAPFIESYQVSDNPIFVGKSSAEVTQDTDALVLLDMQNISARMDLNITTTKEEWSLELHLESNNTSYYSFDLESFLPTEYDYSSLYLWRDHYWKQESYYFLPRDITSINLWFYEYPNNLNVNYQFDIDPNLEMEVGDVFTLNIDLDELIEGGGSASFDWEEINWNDIGDVSIP